jgi:hypothetical protein
MAEPQPSGRMLHVKLKTLRLAAQAGEIEMIHLLMAPGPSAALPSPRKRPNPPRDARSATQSTPAKSHSHQKALFSML